MRKPTFTKAVAVLAFAATAVLPHLSHAMTLPEPDNSRTAVVVWNGPDNQYVTSALATASGWYWGTDNDGLWRYNPAALAGAKWQHFRAQDGLYDDSITALCQDRLGRIWVGTERRGVSVYNGVWWHNYDAMSGPMGVHINAIALDPVTGDIWLGSECGIAIYSESHKSWRYLSRADGLVSDKITAIAFGAKGTVFVGTAADGLMQGLASASPATWHTDSVAAGANYVETGPGLPSAQVNCLTVNGDGKVFCGTEAGLANSTDNGATWTYIHGWDWQEKVKREAGQHHHAVTDTQMPLADDVVTSVAFDSSGHLIVGHRQRGIEIYDDKTGEQLYHTPFDAYGLDIRTIVPVNGGLLVGEYGSGIELATWSDIATHLAAPKPPASKGAVPLMPIPAAPPDAAQLKAMTAKVSALGSGGGNALGYYEGEDWMTQGDWVGSYGLDDAMFCAEDGATDLDLSTTAGYGVTPQLGNSAHEGEDVSHWLYWDSTGDPRCLFDPSTGVRRQAEWNDHGERYSLLYEGPDLWLSITVPVGVHRVSLYFMNKDGHTKLTRFRDYVVELRRYIDGTAIGDAYSNRDVLPLVAQTRVHDFWPGVYERFVVTGPGKYYIKIDRNYSLNTMVQGVFFDRIDAPRKSWSPSWLNGVTLNAGSTAGTGKPKFTQSVLSASKLWTMLDSSAGDNRTAAMQRPYRIQLLRAAVAAGAPSSLTAEWRHELGIWSDTDWPAFNSYMEKASAAVIRLKAATASKSKS